MPLDQASAMQELPNSNKDFPAFFDAYQEQIAEILKRPMLFVCGAPKSGTTWLQLSLNHHPEIHCGGEGHFSDWLGRPLHDLLRAYNAKMKQTNGFIYKDGDATYTEALRQRDMQFILRTMIGMVILSADIKPTAKWIGDKTPLYTASLEYFKLVFPQAKFVTITRDVRDACASTFHQAQRLYREGLNPNKREDPDQVVEPFVKNWVKVQDDCARYDKNHPGTMHQIRYEDLHQNPEETMKTVLEFLEVDTSEEAVGKCVYGGSFERLSEGRKRGEENRDSFFRKGVVGDWVNTFEPRHIELIHSVAGDHLERRGYSLETPASE
ncbi:MAG: sulfotransferase [Alphaproteobacteria bacterium]|nr:sulfotransferase [Alphaproteobacteria bacterium SS10]